MFNLCRCAASSIVNHPKSLSSLRLLPIAGYKSQYSIDKLYPNSTTDFSSNPAFKVGKPGGEVRGLGGHGWVLLKGPHFDSSLIIYTKFAR